MNEFDYCSKGKYVLVVYYTGDYFLLKNQDFDNDSQFVQELFD